MANLPVGTGGYGILSTENPSQNVYKQTFSSHNTGRTWVRTYVNAQWYAWYELVRSADMYFEKGEVYRGTAFYLNGYVTNNTTALNIAVPMYKRMDNISTITVTECIGPIRGIDGYINGSGTSYDWLAQSDITVTAQRSTLNTARLYILKTSAYTGCTNNTPIACGSMTIAFQFS